MSNKFRNGSKFEIYNGRWQDLPGLGRDKIDVICTDPPYSDKVHAGAMFRGNLRDDWKKDTFVQGIDEFEATEGVGFVRKFIEIADRWVLCFCPLEWFGLYEATAQDGAYLRSGIFLKPNGMPQMSGDRPSAGGAEGIAILHKPLSMGRKGRTVWNGGGHHAVWTHNVCRGKHRKHPTQKPLSLMMELVQLFTEPGEVVFDPFGGVMTTGVAALLLGRRFIGCEMDTENGWFDYGCRRLEAAEASLSLEAFEANQQALFTNEELTGDA